MATYEQAMTALRKADAAGNADDARQLAQIAAKLKPTNAEPTLMDRLARKDDAFDYSGVKDFRFRAAYSRRDSESEREDFLKRTVGEGGYTQDRYKRLALTPAGMKRLGMESGSGRPVVADERGLSRYDVADLAGDAPAIAGGLLTAMAATGVGAAPALLLAGLGAAGGKGIGEAVEALRGENAQSAGEVGNDMAVEGAGAMLGEGLFRGILRPIGRYAMAPQAKRMTPESSAIAQESREMGAKPNVSQITKAPILGRAQSISDRIFGDPNAAQNARALGAELHRLAQASGASTGRKATGDAVAQDITRARAALGRWGNIVYGNIEKEAGGKAVVPTQSLKGTAQEIIESLPKKADGTPVLTDPRMVNTIREIGELPENVTIGEMQAIRSRLWDAVDDDTVVPGLTGRNARRLYGATKDAFEAIPDPHVSAMVKRANAAYDKHIAKFDQAIVKRIAKDPSLAGAIPPERVVDTLFTKGQHTNLQKVLRLAKPQTRSAIRNEAMSKVAESFIRRTDDPTKHVFDGKSLANTLDSYGAETIETMFGKDMAKDLHRLARVSQFVNQKMAMSGGLVAAGIAVHPIQNIGRLLRMNVMSKFMNSRTGIKWLTDGLSAPKTRAGAASLSRAYAMMQMMAEDETTGGLPAE